MTAAISLTAPPEPSTVGPLTLAHFVVYQGASCDLAAIHHDPDVARAWYDQPFTPGMYAAGVLASRAAARMGGRNIRRYRVRFANMVWPGDILTSSGRIVSTTVKDDVTVV
jgi:acyl dehydratase